MNLPAVVTKALFCLGEGELQDLAFLAYQLYPRLDLVDSAGDGI
jgi:hypothetical protein